MINRKVVSRELTRIAKMLVSLAEPRKGMEPLRARLVEIVDDLGVVSDYVAHFLYQKVVSGNRNVIDKKGFDLLKRVGSRMVFQAEDSIDEAIGTIMKAVSALHGVSISSSHKSWAFPGRDLTVEASSESVRFITYQRKAMHSVITELDGILRLLGGVTRAERKAKKDISQAMSFIEDADEKLDILANRVLFVEEE